jgi:hypothetical protein
VGAERHQPAVIERILRRRANAKRHNDEFSRIIKFLAFAGTGSTPTIFLDSLVREMEAVPP